MTSNGIFSLTGLLIAGASAYSMSTLFSAMKPVLLTRFVEQVGVAESLAGLIVAMPFVGIAVASLVTRPLINRLSMNQLSVLFGGLLVGGELISAYLFESSSILLFAQFLAGLSVGTLMGATSRVIATTASPDPIFGFVDMMAVFLMSFMIAGVGAAVGAFGLKGGYLFAALIALVFSLLMFAYRKPHDAKVELTATAPKIEINVRPIAVVTMGVLFVTCSGLGFAFMFTIAIELGMDYTSAGSFIGILLLVSAAACQVGGWCSARFGPYRPLATAFLTCAIGWYFAINATSQIMFMIALVPAIFSLQFNFPILLALSGSLDENGQWAAIASPLVTSGFAWAAIAAGAIVTQWNVNALATATLIGMAICGVLLILSRERSDLIAS